MTVLENQTPSRSPAWQTWLCYIVLILATGAVYAPAFKAELVDFDDTNMILQNPFLREPTTQHLEQIWTQPILEMYTPLTYTVWWTTSQSDPGDPLAYHTLNILLHLCAATLVFSSLRFFVKKNLPALIGALFFALHPMQVESVAWVAEMNNVLAGVLSLAALRIYLDFAESQSPRRWMIYAAATFVFILALLAKPTAVILPFVAIALEIGVLGAPFMRSISRMLPWLYLILPIVFITHAIQHGWYSPLIHRPFIALDALGFYLWKIVWPVNLTIDYARAPLRVWNDNLWIATGCTAIIALLGAFFLRCRARIITASVAILVLALLPNLGLVPFSQQQWSTVADRYVYLAMLGPALAITQIPGRPLLILLIALLAWCTFAQTQYWHDTQSLAQHALAVNPVSSVANKIAAANLASNQKWSDAIPYYRKAIAADPLSGDLHYNLANALLETGDPTGAILEYQQAIPLLNESQRPLAVHNLAIAQDQSDKHE